MSITASELRQNIYRLLDHVLRTGEPLEIERKGRKLRLVPDRPVGKLSRIHAHPDALVGDPEDLVSADWAAASSRPRRLGSAHRHGG